MRSFRSTKQNKRLVAWACQLAFVNAASEIDIDKAFNEFRRQRADALLILSDSFLNARRIAELAVQHALPTCFAYREPVVAGGLMGYGASRIDATRQSGVYAARILKGEKPADLPVQQPTKFELVINMKTAKVLGLTVPYSMQLLADEVIE
jgi:putative tryptophan/tyrosine transport system substrate-binding protein